MPISSAEALNHAQAWTSAAAIAAGPLFRGARGVGAAQDMAAAGIDLGAIMHVGGWKSPDMEMRYIEHMGVGKSGIARLYSHNFRLASTSVLRRSSH